MLYEIKTEKRRLRCYITFGFTCEVELDFPMFYEPASDWAQHLGWQDDFENFDNGIYCCSENDFAEILAIMQQAKNAFNDFAIPAFCENFRGSSGNRQPLYDYKTSRGGILFYAACARMASLSVLERLGFGTGVGRYFDRR